MNVTERLAAAHHALAAGNHDGCIDTACLGHAQATGDATRADAIALIARGLIGKELYPDVVLWCDRAPAAPAVLGYRGWAQLRLGRQAEALADLDRAVAGEVPPLIHHYRALALRDAGRRDDAYAAVGRIVDDPDRGASALRLRALWRREDGNHDEARVDLAVAVRRGDTTAAGMLHEDGALPDDPESRFTWAQALGDNEDTDGAIAALDALLATELPAPLRALVHARRGLMANWQRDLAGAVEHYQRAAELAPANLSLLVHHGRALYNADRDEEGRGVLERALALGADNGVADGYLGDVHFVAERFAEAAACYAQSLARSPRNPGLMRRLASALAALDRDDEARGWWIDAAIAGDRDAAERCEQLGEELPSPLFDSACTGLQHGGAPMAIASGLRKAGELWLARSRAAGDFCSRHAAMALSNQAYALGLAGDREAAVVACRRAVELRPGFRDGWNNLGNQLVAVGQLDEAVAAFERCAWCDPSYAGALYGQSDALRRLGRADDTVAALERALAIGYPDAKRQSDIHFRLARALQALGRRSDARDQYEKMAELTGNDDDQAMADAMDRIDQLVDLGAAALTPAPYRRYGLRPERSVEGGTLGCRLQLAAEPDDAIRAAIARAAQLALDPAIELDGPLRWSGRFLFAAVDGDGDHAAGFAAIRAIADAIHAVAPLREAVGLGAVALSPGDPLEDWSIATQPVPDAGPESPRHVGFWVPMFGDPTAFVAPAPNEAAQAALREAHAERARQQAQVWIEAARERMAHGEVVIVPVDDAEVPDGDEPAALGDLVGPDDYARTAAGGGVIVRRHEGYFTGLDRLLPGGGVEPVVPIEGDAPVLLRHLGAVSVSPDGRWALYATQLERELWRVELATGATVKLAELGRKVASTAFLDDGDLVVRTDADLRIYRHAGDALELRACAPVDLGTATVWGGGRLILVGQIDAPALVVYGWADGVLARIAEIHAPINAYTIRTAGGRAFARTDLAVEIVNLDAAATRFEAWARARAAARAAVGGLIVEELAGGPSPGIQEGPSAVREEVAWLVTGHAGLSFALANEDEGYRVVIGDDDGVHEVDPPVTAGSFVYDWRKDGRAALVVAEGTLREVDLVAHTSRALGEGVERACYTRDGHAAIEGAELVLYRWPGQGAAPEELGRVEVDEDVDELAYTADGAALVVVAGGRTMVLALEAGAVSPLGAVDLDGWYAIWNRDGVTYLQLSDDGADDPVRRFRIAGVDVAGADSVEALVVADVPAATLWETGAYEGATVWGTGGTVEDDDDLGEDDDDLDDDEEEK